MLSTDAPAALLSGLLPVVRDAVVDALGASRVDAASLPRPVRLGVPNGAKAPLIAALAGMSERPVLVITDRPSRAHALREDLQAWLPQDTEGAQPHAPQDVAPPVMPFPAREALPYERRTGPDQASQERLQALDALAAGERLIVVADAHAVAQGTCPPGALRTLPSLRVGEPLRVDALLAALDSAGYVRTAAVDEPGTFARRGGIIDVFPSAADAPFRIELFGDEVESLRLFDPLTQRSTGELAGITVGPATEAVVDAAARSLAGALDTEGAQRTPAKVVAALRDPESRQFAAEIEQIARGALPDALPFWTPFLARSGVWEHLPPDSLIVWDEPAEGRRLHEEMLDEAARVRDDLVARALIPAGLPLPLLNVEALAAALGSRRPRIDLLRFATDGPRGDTHRLPFTAIEAYGGGLARLMADLERGRQDGRRSVLVSLQAPRLAELFEESGLPVTTTSALRALPPRGSITLLHGAPGHGWRLPSTGGQTALLTDAEIFGFAKQRRARRQARRRHTGFLDDLQPGDFVVHVDHGIARFVGISRERIGDREREYVELTYAQNDRLLVPTDQLHRVQRYVGPSAAPPAPTRLGTQQWQRAKQRVRAQVQELAEGLLQLYAARQVLPGIAMQPDSPWQLELEAAFPYVETADQAAAVARVKADMERPRPMDRIVVGDVGYGKTEVAVRAAFKAVMSGYQVAMLVPTTVLAQQHFNTFRERMAPFPVRVEMLSRFRAPAEQRAILERMAAGQVDLVVGTHRLLQKDVRFNSLGLVIVDEEQRFGVEHKERLTQMRREVDVLTLSATPIPRTLQMALGGIRDMATIETPPEERLPIVTYVMESDDHVVREAILREIERGGQVYFVHNRVQTIERVARRLRDLVPEARFLVGHGQMPEERLATVMQDFIAGDADVLLCTTIIESGLDIPNVNTIIVDQAHRLGLAQLYQLRGRVGRGATRAYAFLLYNRHQALSETAEKRLQTIFDATDLGAGFQIALKDLEIRGAGNLLGAKQSGPIGAVGFQLYTEMLREAVEQLRAQQEGRPPTPPRRGPTVSLDLPIVAHLPESYVPDLNLRLAVYQSLAAVEDTEGAAQVAADLSDRFGPPPPPVRNLLAAVRLRALAARLGAESLAREEDVIAMRLAEGLTFDRDRWRGALPDGVTVGRTLLRLDMRRLGDRWLEVLEQTLSTLAQDATAPTPTPKTPTAAAVGR